MGGGSTSRVLGMGVMDLRERPSASTSTWPRGMRDLSQRYLSSCSRSPSYVAATQGIPSTSSKSFR